MNGSPLALVLRLLGPAPEAAPQPDIAAEVAPEPGAPAAPVDAEPSVATEAPAPEPDAPAEPPITGESGETFTVAAGERTDGPPFYTKEDTAKLRRRFGLPAEPTERPRQARWRCLIADPTCGINFEVNATSAYAYRARQGSLRSTDDVRKWSSFRTQYDFWLNIPVLTEQVGRDRYTRITMGPKGGVVFSDSMELWGNLGVTLRTWLGRGRWAPTLEFTSALSFKIGGQEFRDGEPGDFEMQRGPVGFTADIGVGLGGFGAIVLGGQYDSPLAREDVPEEYHVQSSGMFFLGFRGNILWGGPAAASVVTHGLGQRYTNQPR